MTNVKTNTPRPFANRAFSRSRTAYGTADVKRRGGSNIQIFLNADSISDCTGAYLKSEDPRDLLACSP